MTDQNREGILTERVENLIAECAEEACDIGIIGDVECAEKVIALVREQVAREIDAEYRKRKADGLSEALYGLDIAEQVVRGEL